MSFTFQLFTSYADSINASVHAHVHATDPQHRAVEVKGIQHLFMKVLFYLVVGKGF